MKASTVYCLAVVIAFSLVAGFACPATAAGEEFGGFGMTVAQLFDGDSPGSMGSIVVLYAPRESEAGKAGIRAGDAIVEIDGKQTAGRQFGDVVLNDLRGRVGSVSELKLRRAPDGAIVTVSVTRALIKYPPEQGEGGKTAP